MTNKPAGKFWSLLNGNCADYFGGRISLADFSLRQQAIWDEIESAGLKGHVLALFRVPPYSVRKQMREATLRVGR